MLGVVSAEAEREIRAVLPFKFQTGEADRAIKAAILAAYRVS